MAVFLDSPCRLPRHAEQVECVAWHESESVLAVACASAAAASVGSSSAVGGSGRPQWRRQVCFFQEEGESLPISIPATKDVQVSQMEWQPRGSLLAIGWADGQVSTWVLESRKSLAQTYHNDRIHGGSEIAFLLWAPSGSRLVTGDRGGICQVWKVDSRGMLTPAVSYSQVAALTRAVFSTNAMQATRNELLVHTYCPSFFYGCENGLVTYADDLGHKTDVTQLSAAIDVMMYYQERRLLVIITRSLRMTQFRVGDDGTVQRVMHMKLSLGRQAAEHGILQATWAGPGLLAAATNESFLRIWDLKNDSNCNISLASIHRAQQTAAAVGSGTEGGGRGGDAAGSPSSASASSTAAGVRSGGSATIVSASSNVGADSITSVSFAPAKRYLVAGTKRGTVAIWKFKGDYNRVDERGRTVSVAASDWEVVCSSTGHDATGDSGAGGGGGSGSEPSSFSAVRVHNVLWSASQRLLGVMTRRGVRIMSESVLQRAFCEGVAVVQLDNHTLATYMRDEASEALADPRSQDNVQGNMHQRVVIDAGLIIRGLATDGNRIVVWSTRAAKVFALNGQPDLGDRSEVERHATVNSPSARGGTGGGRGGTQRYMELEPDCMDIAIKDSNLFVAQGYLVRVTNFLGYDWDAIRFVEAEGRPTHLATNGDFLGVATDAGIIKTFNIHNPKKPVQLPQSTGRFVDSLGESLGLISSIAISCDGKRVSITSDTVEPNLQILQPDTRLHVFDVDRAEIMHYDFGPTRRRPAFHCWEQAEPVLLACETHGQAVIGGVELGEEPEINVTTLFVTAENGVMMQGSVGVAPPYGSLIGMQLPRLFFTMAASAKSGAGAATTVTSAGSGGSGVASNTIAVGSANAASQSPGVTGSPAADVSMSSDSPNRYDGSAEAKMPDSATRGGRGGGSHGGDSKPSGSPHKQHQQQQQQQGSGGRNTMVLGKVLRDFMGLESVDDQRTRRALLDFSYHLTVGNLDRAYGAVKTIDSAYVWENIAHMCVKSQRLDVAEICMGYMGNARGAAAVARAKEEYPEQEACVGVVAVQLGLLDEAARLFRECGRHDLLNKLYQAAGRWDRALEVATSNDRVHLKTTHHNFAKHLESIGDIEGAIRHYERADTFRIEVPRMLFQLGRMEELEDYVNDTRDPELLKWWASYMESRERYDRARRCYARAGDTLSLVRLACHDRKMRQAVEIVTESGDAAAAYHLARHYEVQRDIRQAISYYAQSGCYNHAIRLAKNYGLDSELMSFALKARPSLMIDVAQYFEQQGELDKAAQLYHKGGDVPKALDVCFRAGDGGRTDMFDLLKLIAEDLASNVETANPQVLARCAEFFITHAQYEQAVHLYISGRRYRQAIEMCVQHRVTITDTMAEQLTPERTNDAAQNEERAEVLALLARALKKQGSLQLASKKYTQAGDRTRALKCLLKAGDTRNVIYYAQTTRKPDIYILAANYLQTLDWHSDNSIVKAIVNFYKRAKEYQLLADFHELCAQTEMDEYQDYDKALKALQDAAKCLTKAAGTSSRAAMSASTAGTASSNEELLADLHRRISIVERFVEARQSSHPERMVEACEELLQEPRLESAIRAGDVYGLLIEHFHNNNDDARAFDYIKQMREQRIPLDPYTDQRTVEQIHNAVGEPMPRTSGGGGRRGDGAGNGGAGGHGGDGPDSGMVEEDEQGAGGSGRRDRGASDHDAAGGHSRRHGGGGDEEDELDEEIPEDDGDPQSDADDDDDDYRAYLGGK